MKPTILSVCLSLLLFLLFHCGSPEEGPQTPSEPAGNWYKGNTHAHTVICGHADTEPAEVVRWYHDRAYHFLILSEHNHFINPDTVALPDDPREDFILIPGEEVTGAQAIHTTAMNIGAYVDPGPEGPDKTAIMQAHVDSTRAQQGIPILNHPNFVSGAYARDILPVKRLHLFELYNGHPLVYNWGEHVTYHHVSTEAKWDSLLSGGMRMYGVSSDDAHIFQAFSYDQSNPGRGWVMVRSDTLTPASITDAMARGDFYASSGVILREVEKSGDRYSLAIDTAATNRELESPFLIGRRADETKTGYFIQFFGDRGRLLHEVEGLEAAYTPQSGDAYVRAKVTCRRRKGSLILEHYAWTQPVFEGTDF